MRLLILSLVSFLPAPAFAAAGYSSSIPVRVQYAKTGREDDAKAEKQGAVEVENANPCVGKMRRDLVELEKRKEVGDAATAVLKSFDGSVKLVPHLVLRYMAEAMELRFELRTVAEREDDGFVRYPEVVKYRKSVYITDRPGSWQERLDTDQCHVSEAKLLELVDELREADRLASCVMRKREILEGSEKISNYVHSYLPVNWLAEARRKLILQNAPVGSLLREDQAIYRSGNGSFKECQRGLRLLEEEAASSVRVLNEVRDTRKGTDVPTQELDDLERLLSGISK